MGRSAYLRLLCHSVWLVASMALSSRGPFNVDALEWNEVDSRELGLGAGAFMPGISQMPRGNRRETPGGRERWSFAKLSRTPKWKNEAFVIVSLDFHDLCASRNRGPKEETLGFLAGKMSSLLARGK